MSMGIMDSVVSTNGVVVLELGVGKRGQAIYRLSVYHDGKWTTAKFKTFDDAYSAYKLTRKVLNIR